MKLARMSILVGALVVVVCSGTEIAWATRVLGVQVTGEVTATPMSDQIEVDHHVFHFEPNSLADKTARSIRVGQIVDLVLDAPANSPSAHVMSIGKHAGS
ncbi:MAG: hypothetical protein M3N50_11595 [Pseudomonadota bacterium]|nr:hypothetical protein [Pseudomonadota bacterium]